MKTKVQPVTGIISVVINTAHGRCTISTGCTDPDLTGQVIEAAKSQA